MRAPASRSRRGGVLSAGVWVIFEGVDGGGKTSLAARAATFLADPRTPGGGPTVLHHLTSESTFDEYWRPPAWTREGLNVVEDRSLLSDLVYAPVWMGIPSRLGEDRVRSSLRRQACDALVVHVTASEGVLLNRMRKRADVRPGADPGEGQVHALLKNYWREVGWWREEGATVMEIDTSDGFPSDVELELTLSVGWEQLGLERGG